MHTHRSARARSDPGIAAAIAGPGGVDELDDLHFAIADRLRPTLADVDHIAMHFERHGSDVTVHMAGPPISDMRRQAVAVRVLDAVRTVGRTFGHVDVDYQARPH